MVSLGHIACYQPHREVWNWNVPRRSVTKRLIVWGLESWGEHFGTVDLACERMFLGGQKFDFPI